MAEDGTIPEHYPVIELSNAGYSERTARNVADSDGTLIISNREPIGGTRETVDRCVKMHKPYLVIDCEQIPPQEAIESAVAFLRSLAFKAHGKLKLPQQSPSTPLGMTVLNVAGPRASQWPEGHALTYQIMSAILRRISGQQGAVGYSF